MQIKKDDIREKILEVSGRLFIKNGYEKTSLRMISEKSYISKSNIYRYFESKEEIYETLVGPARQSMIELIGRFNSVDFTGRYTTDKIEEISDVIAGSMSRYRSGYLIMLNAEGGKDQQLLRQKFKDMFISACPLEDEEYKSMIVSLFIAALIDILVKNSEKEVIRYRLKLLLYYHYLGLDGIKKAFKKA